MVAIAGGAGEEVKLEAGRRRIRVLEPLVEPDGHELEIIGDLIGAGRLKVVIEDLLPLKQAAQAHRRLEGQRGRRGKLVLVP